jgi:hypothetical protein
VTDFVNLKIKTAQSFRCAHKNRMCVCVYKDEYSYMYEYLRSGTKPEIKLERGQTNFKTLFLYYEGSNSVK